ncbi:peptidase M28-like protein [Kribbella voronezhensis]|uniref:Peptidase M28-like protein n=1 Tax=Kribbella voronezhensis TaxID=2512212 RepID=A0A4R7T8V3_9ACTN|nr:M28 family metallopeptidase [Kribbella voronezhensis]TDU87638.1 peptidase M28-like protein [Kribbella voronezhensis]
MSTRPPVRYHVVATGENVEGASSARFGDQAILWVPAGERLGRGSRTAPGLLVVTQVGRSFQDEYPEVVPLLDHGRHLVISTADKPRKRSNHCWRIEPLQPGSYVEVAAPKAARVDPTVTNLLDRLSPTSYEADLTWLASLPTRHSLSASFTAAVDFAEARMVALGYKTTRLPITVGAGRSENLIGDRPGLGPGSRGLVVITAHLDSINLAGGPAGNAPGADDNASGSAGVLELGRLLAGQGWQHDVRLILFGGEEEGLFGSKQYVAALPAAERARIRAVLNLDMIASRNSATPTVLLEGAPVSSGQISELAAAAATYTGLQVETSLNPFASDHVPFINAAIPAVLTIEGADSANGHIHSANDTLDFLDWSLAAEILRMNAAALAGWLLPATATVRRPIVAGPVVAWGPDRLDVFVTGPDSALHHKSWTGDTWSDYETLGGVIG